MTADQVVAALWRRRILVAAVMGAVLVTGTLVVATLPAVYKATSVVHIEPQRPDSQLVQRTVGDVEPRLLSIKQELMGRPVLDRVIDEVKPYPALLAKRGREAVAEQLRQDLDVKADGDAAFEVTVTSGNRELAARIANKIPEVYASQLIQLRAEQAKNATDVFSGEVGSLQTAVTNWERRIVQFKVDHMGELPEQVESNMRQLDRIAGEMRSKSEELRAVEQRRSELARARNGGDTDAGRYEAAAAGLAQQLSSARTKYTDDHPEVQRLTGELESTRRRAAEAANAMTADRTERGRATRLTDQIGREIGGLQKEAGIYQARLDKAPRWAAELGALERDYEITKAKYASVMGRKVEAEIAQELEAKNSSRLFNVISPAGVPVAAAKPDRFTGLLIVLLAALGAGILTGVFMELRDDSIRDREEIQGRLPVPVLAVIPAIGGRTERRVLMPATQTRAAAGGQTDPTLN